MSHGLRSALEVLAPGIHRDTLDSRLALVVYIEGVMLALRYFLLLILVGVYAVGIDTPYSPNLWLIVIAALVQNACVHAVFYRRRYNFFLSPYNFALYLSGISIAVGSTGGEESPIALGYILFIIGYCAYSPYFINTYLVSLLCCAAYAITVVAHWAVVGVNSNYPPIGIHMATILLGGLLTSALGESLRKLRIEAISQTQALASAKATVRAILNSTAEPIVVYAENEFIIDANERACEFIGLPREKLLGQRFRAFLFDDGSLPNRFANLRARGEYQGELLVISAEGQEHTVDVRVRSFIQDDQRFFVAVLHDITRQKNLQEASRLANQRLEQINRELQQVNELRRAFMKTVSQRLRSPMSAMLGFIDLMLEEELGEITAEQRKALQSCRRDVFRVLNLVDEPFDQSSAHTPKTIEVPEPPQIPEDSLPD